jgi:hypothetical protein
MDNANQAIGWGQKLKFSYLLSLFGFYNFYDIYIQYRAHFCEKIYLNDVRLMNIPEGDLIDPKTERTFLNFFDDLAYITPDSTDFEIAYELMSVLFLQDNNLKHTDFGGLFSFANKYQTQR